MVVKGRNRDTAWFAMTDADWPALRAALVAWLDPANFTPDGAQIRRLEDFRPADAIRRRKAAGRHNVRAGPARSRSMPARP